MDLGFLPDWWTRQVSNLNVLKIPSLLGESSLRLAESKAKKKNTKIKFTYQEPGATGAILDLRSTVERATLRGIKFKTFLFFWLLLYVSFVGLKTPKVETL